MRELDLEMPEGKEVECLMDAIKAQLRRSSRLSEKQETAARRQAVLKNVPAGQAVPEDLLAAASTRLAIFQEAPRMYENMLVSDVRDVQHSVGFSRKIHCSETTQSMCSDGACHAPLYYVALAESCAPSRLGAALFIVTAAIQSVILAFVGWV
jgi:hypothetical protein